MYKQNKTRLEQSRRPLLWIKRRLLLIVTAFILGMANGMNAEDARIKGNQNYKEQHKKD